MRSRPPKAGSSTSKLGPARLVVVMSLAVSAALVPAAAGIGGPGVTPASVDVTLAPGGSVVINKLVETAAVSSKPDVMFLADTTGSMGSSIANVQSSIADIITSVRGVQPDAQFGAAQYKDVVDPFAYQLDHAISSDDTAVSNADRHVVSFGWWWTRRRRRSTRYITWRPTPMSVGGRVRAGSSPGSGTRPAMTRALVTRSPARAQPCRQPASGSLLWTCPRST